MKRVLGLLLALTTQLAPGSLRADLEDTRDVERALSRLENGASTAQRRDAARWLGHHASRGLALPHLLDALERETSTEVLGPLTHAIARLAGPEDAARLIRLAPSVRSPFRGVLVVGIAQLGTEASDAFLAQELAALGAVSIECAQPTVGPGGSPASERVSLVALAETRRDTVVPLLLREATPARLAPLEALVALGHEDARPLYLRLLEDPALGPLALEGLAALRPDAVTAEQLAQTRTPSPVLARALFAADPNSAVLDTWLRDGPADVQRAVRALRIVHAPERLERDEVLAHVEQDAPAWSASFAAPQPAANAAYLLLMTSEEVPVAVRQAAFDAHLQLASADRQRCTDEAPRLDGTAALVAAARRARICETAFSAPPSLTGEQVVFLRALAFEDVRDALRRTWEDAASDPDRRMDLAHAFWLSREADGRLAEAWAEEPNEDVRDVLSLAVHRHHVTVDPSLLAARLEAPRTRLSSLLVVHAQPSLHPITRPHVLAALRDEVPRVRAAALMALAPFEEATHLAPWACAALEGSELERAAARAVLPELAPCLQQAARVDAWLRSPLAPMAASDAVVFVQGDARPRLLFDGADASFGMVHPTSLGVVVFPGVRASLRVAPALF